MQCHSWLTHCATRQKAGGSIPDDDGIFCQHNPSSHNMALGSTQSLKEMSTRNIILGVRAASAWAWQPCHFHVLILLKTGSLTLPESSGSVQAYTGIAVPFIFLEKFILIQQTTKCHKSEDRKIKLQCFKNLKSSNVCRMSASAQRVDILQSVIYCAIFYCWTAYCKCLTLLLHSDLWCLFHNPESCSDPYIYINIKLCKKI
jgi:hypothetical protein